MKINDLLEGDIIQGPWTEKDKEIRTKKQVSTDSRRRQDRSNRQRRKTYKDQYKVEFIWQPGLDQDTSFGDVTDAFNGLGDSFTEKKSYLVSRNEGEIKAIENALGMFRKELPDISPKQVRGNIYGKFGSTYGVKPFGNVVTYLKRQRDFLNPRDKLKVIE